MIAKTLISGFAWARRGAAPLAAAACLLWAGCTAHAAAIATWTFETSLPSATGTAAGPYSAEIGTGSATGMHASSATFNNVSGNGSSHSFSSNTWAIGDYYQFQVSTTGLQDIVVSWDQTSSNTGPRDFDLQYSTNGSSFTSFFSYQVLANGLTPNPAWNGTTSSAAYSYSQDLSAIAAIENAANVYLRLTATSLNPANPTSTFGAGGTDRVDNFSVSASPVPEPSMFVLAALGFVGLAVRGWRKR